MSNPKPVREKTDSIKPTSEETIITDKEEKPEKPIKPEQKPFFNFINEDLLPEIKNNIERRGIILRSLSFVKGERPVTGGECWSVIGEIETDRKFWLSFSEDKITSQKTISLAEGGKKATLLESFLIDEKKTTLALLVSRLLQRLNGQKWLGPN